MPRFFHSGPLRARELALGWGNGFSADSWAAFFEVGCHENFGGGFRDLGGCHESIWDFCDREEFIE